MLYERTAGPVGSAPRNRTVPQVMRLVADLLEAVPGLPGLSVDVIDAWHGDPSVALQMGHWNAPQDKFPAVARLLQHLGGRPPVAQRMPSGNWHFRGTTTWRGIDVTVFAVTNADDAGRGAEQAVA